jgi:alpha-L-arabinofuranosidase
MKQIAVRINMIARRFAGLGFCAGVLMFAGYKSAAAQSTVVNAPAPMPANATLSVDVDKPGVRISPMLYGLMTEEINHSYDGGLYGELIQNRIFKDDPNVPKHWSVVNSGGAIGSIALDAAEPVNTSALTTSLRLTIPPIQNGDQRVGIANDGYWGIPVLANTHYTASFYAKADDKFGGPLFVSLESADGQTVYARATVPPIAKTWQQYTVALDTKDLTSSANNRFVVWAGGTKASADGGTVWFNLVSLFPPTYHDRPNGNRTDLMQMLADMQPAFLRLPGGNYLEGDTIAQRFDWKKTIHGLDQRPGHQGPWGYRSSDGLGLLEFLEWCEDLKMEPVLAVYAGYSLKGEHIEPGPDFQPFVQDALDEIEYATGDATTTWGKVRAADGHPEPFKIEYVEIGNEDWFDRSRSYNGRFAQFYDAIKSKYPNLQLIATTRVRGRTPDVIDDHYYHSARDMEGLAHHYDRTNRDGPKIFVGEWATTEGKPTPTLNAALGDAAFMTGMERNSDVIVMASYAPLLVNVNKNASQWGTNLIGYDALTSFGSPSYYAQKMFNENRGDVVLPVELTQPATTETNPMPHGSVGVGTWTTNAQYKDIKVTVGNAPAYQSDFTKGMDDWKRADGDWSVQDGTLQQAANSENCYATTGDAGWTDYTYSLKARKLDGAEGFLILFHYQNSDSFLWWNIAGWGNTRTQMEQVWHGGKNPLGPSVPLSIETGRWYDIRIELKGRSVRCYLDDKLILSATDAIPPPPPPLFATASRADKNGDVILKVVNVSHDPIDTAVNLHGVTALQSGGKAIVLTSDSPDDQNTIAEPTKVFPKEEAITDTTTSFHRVFPAHSVTVMRLPASTP